MTVLVPRLGNPNFKVRSPAQKEIECIIRTYPGALEIIPILEQARRSSDLEVWNQAGKFLKMAEMLNTTTPIWLILRFAVDHINELDKETIYAILGELLQRFLK